MTAPTTQPGRAALFSFVPDQDINDGVEATPIYEVMDPGGTSMCVALDQIPAVLAIPRLLSLLGEVRLLRIVQRQPSLPKSYTALLRFGTESLASDFLDTLASSPDMDLACAKGHLFDPTYAPGKGLFSTRDLILGLDRPSDCPICLDALDGDATGDGSPNHNPSPNSLVSLSCSHWFHLQCLVRCTGSACPVCRQAPDGAPMAFAEVDNSPPAALLALDHAYFAEEVARLLVFAKEVLTRLVREHPSHSRFARQQFDGVTTQALLITSQLESMQVEFANLVPFDPHSKLRELSEMEHTLVLLASGHTESLILKSSYEASVPPTRYSAANLPDYSDDDGPSLLDDSFEDDFAANVRITHRSRHSTTYRSAAPSPAGGGSSGQTRGGGGGAGPQPEAAGNGSPARKKEKGRGGTPKTSGKKGNRKDSLLF